MKQLAYMMIAMLTLGACDIYTSDNGDLDGYWQLHTVDTLSTGVTCDMRDSMKYWSYQTDLLYLTDRTEDVNNIFMRFEMKDGQMTVSNPIIDKRDSFDIVLKDYDILRHYGIHDVPETLRIVELTSGRMVLENRLLRLYFRKY